MRCKEDEAGAGSLPKGEIEESLWNNNTKFDPTISHQV
jgi:hypothetical protein